MTKVRKRILLLAEAQSNHTYKWAKALAKRDYCICVFSLNPCASELYSGMKYLEVVSCKVSKNLSNKPSNHILKIQYLKTVFLLRKIIKRFRPDIVHAHYATSYGLLGVLSGFQPLLISVWGSDIFDFPKKSFFHKKLLKYNLSKARLVLSASKALATETKKYTQSHIEIVPFGIDTEIFKPWKGFSLFEEQDIVIGTIKSLEKVYGIDYLVKAFSIVKNKYPDLSLKLLIVGSGTKENHLKALADQLNIMTSVVFTGRINFEDIPAYHNMMNIFVALSLSESFGVSILEACACCRPVIVTDVGGLPEVVQNNITGIIVPSANETAAAHALERLISDSNLRSELGNNGRARVIANYNWSENLLQMVELYEKVLTNNSISNG
jgi:L-malate glycosyltransferase